VRKILVGRVSADAAQKASGLPPKKPSAVRPELQNLKAKGPFSLRKTGPLRQNEDFS
jgi:hypothetical protein